MSLKVPRRAFYPYTCSKCGKSRSARKYRRALGKVCTLCAGRVIPENQPSLFSDPITTPEDIKVVQGYNGTMNLAIDNKHKVIFHPAAAGEIDFVDFGK